MKCTKGNGEDIFLGGMELMAYVSEREGRGGDEGVKIFVEVM